jgi:hypothetical protein
MSQGGPDVIDVTIPRECVYREFEGDPGPCPRCGGPLQAHPATYLVATRRGRKSTSSFFVGSDMGWFCARCPTVVINPEEVSEYLLHGKPEWNVGTELAVLGIVDLDAIPEEKRDVLLGEDDNPIPLVEFTNISREAAPHRASGPSRAIASRRAAPARDGGRFEERYEDILQNIEFGIVQVYHSHPEMTDWEVLTAVEALIRAYNAEAKGRQATPASLVPLAQEVYESVKMMCEWRLGRETPFRDEGEPVDIPVEPISLDEIVACLKRVRKSINRWTRTGGRQGYLTFVSQFIA